MAVAGGSVSATVQSARPRLLRALAREPADATPVWLMRQAGRFLPEYRKIREKHSILDIIANPEIAAEATLQPLRRFELDAAIIFADLLPPLSAMGLEVAYVAGDGPVIRNPVRTTRDIDLLAVPAPEEHLGSTFEAIRIVKTEIGSSGVPLIGFAGAPFTLASYAVEGGGSRNYAATKTLMYREPVAWKRLMTKLTTLQAAYLSAQAAAGADVLQVFDSWAGIALGRDDYLEYVAPYNRMLFSALSRSGEIPVINFSTGTAAYIEDVAACGGDAIGVDWRLPLDRYWDRIGDDRSVQGNLDPVTLLGPWREIKVRVDRILHGVRGRNGHVFNLGHGVLPGTDPDIVARLIDYVHESTRRATPDDASTG